MDTTWISKILASTVARPRFSKILSCKGCGRVFTVAFPKDPVSPALFSVTVVCPGCRHQNKVPIDQDAAAGSEWTVEWKAE